MNNTEDIQAGAAEVELRSDRAVLALLLDSYPAPFARDEIIRELAGQPADFGQCDQIENSLRDLVGYGLVHEHGGFFFATRAAHAAARLTISP